MINLLVVSDTHGNYRLLEKVLLNQFKFNDKYRPTHLIHLGDGVDDIEKTKISERFCVCAVKGNCDSLFYNHSYPKERILEFSGCRILMMHGHTHSVKLGINQAVLYADECGADVLLYGHTHITTSYTLESRTAIDGICLKKSVVVFNPGSLGYDGNFGTVSIDNGNIFCTHGNIIKNSDV